jgi:hypothetical protein
MPSKRHSIRCLPVKHIYDLQTVSGFLVVAETQKQRATVRLGDFDASSIAGRSSGGDPLLQLLRA